MKIGDAGDRAPGKIVDLDPMQQMVSTIFGLRMRLIGNGDEDIFTGNFVPAPFTDILFTRDGGPGSLYQSVLTGDEGGPPTWSKALGDLPCSSANPLNNPPHLASALVNFDILKTIHREHIGKKNNSPEELSVNGV
jgi:hypothetical protein